MCFPNSSPSLAILYPKDRRGKEGEANRDRSRAGAEPGPSRGRAGTVATIEGAKIQGAKIRFFGPSLALLWPFSGPFLAHLWSFFGPSLALPWLFFGNSLAILYAKDRRGKERRGKLGPSRGRGNDRRGNDRRGRDTRGKDTRGKDTLLWPLFGPSLDLL